jgi:hypothetical protein
MNFARSLAAFAAAATMLVSMAQPEAAPVHIGAANSVSDEVQGVLPGQQDILKPGSKVFHDEIVRTNQKSLAQLLFLDNSSLSVATSSEVKLDKFVYDPNQHTGQVVLNATRGVFRFVAGAQDPKSYSIKTPAATIGVRGTIVNVSYSNGGLIVQLEEGSAYITTPDGHEYDITTPGWGFVVSADGTVTGPEKIEGALKDPFQVGWSKFYLTSLKQQLAGGIADPGSSLIDTLAGILDGAILDYGDDYAAEIAALAISEFKDAGLTEDQIDQILDKAAGDLPDNHDVAVAALTGPGVNWPKDQGNKNSIDDFQFINTGDTPPPPCANPSCT